jgi:hypothetical protein
MTDLTAPEAANEQRWANAEVTRDFTAAAKRLMAQEAKAQYLAAEAKTGAP